MVQVQLVRSNSAFSQAYLNLTQQRRPPLKLACQPRGITNCINVKDPLEHISHWNTKTKLFLCEFRFQIFQFFSRNLSIRLWRNTTNNRKANKTFDHKSPLKCHSTCVSIRNDAFKVNADMHHENSCERGETGGSSGSILQLIP